MLWLSIEAGVRCGGRIEVSKSQSFPPCEGWGEMVKTEVSAHTSPSSLGMYLHLSHGHSLSGKEKLSQLYPGWVTCFVHRQTYPRVLVQSSHPVHKFIVNPVRHGALGIRRDGKCSRNDEVEKDCALLQLLHTKASLKYWASSLTSLKLLSLSSC